MLGHLRGAGRVLDLGCGEGQIARHLLRAGAVQEVVGVDRSAAQIATARERAGGPRYVRASVDALPIADAACDAVVACLVLEHVVDLEPAIGEVARVLRPGGVFLLLLNHPLLQVPGSGWIDDQILGEQYWRVGSYLAEDVSIEEIAPGVRLPFVHRPLSRYVNALAAHRLLVEHLDEPAPPAGFLSRAPEYASSVTIPRLLGLRLLRG